MDLVAALEAQLIQRSGDQIAAGSGNLPPNVMSMIDGSGMNSVADGSPTTFSPKEMRKSDSKKRWKNWGWKYSPGKTSSIEEEPDTSRHSSPTSSPKHKKVGDQATAAATAVTNFLAQSSPLRRRPKSSEAATRMANGGANANATTAANMAATRTEIRSSAGARLCQALEESQDDSSDEFQALIINGRPASVHIVPMSSTSQ